MEQRSGISKKKVTQSSRGFKSIIAFIVNMIGDIIGGIFPLIRTIFKPILLTVAILLIFAIITSILGLAVGWTMGGYHMTVLGPEMDYLAWAGVVALFFLVAIPLLGLVQWIFRLSWHYRLPKGLSNTMAWMWSFAFVISFCVLVITAKDYSHKFETSEISSYNIDNQVIYLNMPPESKDEFMTVHLGSLAFTNQEDTWALKNINISLDKSVDDQVHVKRTVFARGRSEAKAANNAQSIDNEFSVEGNQFAMSKYIQFPIKQRYRGQKIEYVFYVPEGCTIEMDKSIYHNVKSKSRYDIETSANDDGAEKYLLKF